MAKGIDYHDYLIETLKEPSEAAGYLNAALDDDIEIGVGSKIPLYLFGFSISLIDLALNGSYTFGWKIYEAYTLI